LPKQTPRIATNLGQAAQIAKQEQPSTQQAHSPTLTKTAIQEVQKQAFGQAEAQAAWKLFFQQNPNGSPFLSFLADSRITVGQMPQITVILQHDNPAIEQEFRSLQEKMTIFLRDRLKNDLVELILEKAHNTQTTQQSSSPSSSNTPKKVYSNEEKFDYFAQHYPQLEEIKRKFNLQIE
jgi:hypothetical protein